MHPDCAGRVRITWHSGALILAFMKYSPDLASYCLVERDTRCRLQNNVQGINSISVDVPDGH